MPVCHVGKIYRELGNVSPHASATRWPPCPAVGGSPRTAIPAMPPSKPPSTAFLAAAGLGAARPLLGYTFDTPRC
ncbi:hypothetical protein ACIQNU_43320 [Streptomyces sp. NPDC091292]|uniref:hypothetical protein n=1 Tax=Streptomyces sp. NPDC091292 TaxID=3365991 RepID=UPI0037F7832A